MSDPVPPQLEDAVLTALGLVYVSGTACGEMCSVDSLGRLVRPCSASKSRRVRLRLADFICEVVLSGQIVGSMLIVAWVNVRSRELRADGPPCDAEGDDIRLLVRLDLIAFCP